MTCLLLCPFPPWYRRLPTSQRTKAAVVAVVAVVEEAAEEEVVAVVVIKGINGNQIHPID